MGPTGPPGNLGLTLAPITWSPTGYPANCVTLFRSGNLVTFYITTNTTNAPTTVTTNAMPLGYRPPFTMAKLFAGMSSNGKESQMAINITGTIQGSIGNAAPINQVFSWLTPDPLPDNMTVIQSDFPKFRFVNNKLEISYDGVVYNEVPGQ
jgi:hypothetical protein